MPAPEGRPVSSGRASVSRETPPAPASVRGAFAADRWPAVERYAELLAHEAVTRGLIGPREVPRLWTRHLANCAALADAIAPGAATVCDLGTGAGLPGVVLAIRRPELRVALVEPQARRTAFLEEVLAVLCLDNAEVIRARAQDLHGGRTFDVVTSRAVAPLPRLLAWSLPLVSPRGALLAMKGAKAAEEVAEARGVLDDWGCAPAAVHSVGRGWIDPPTTVVRVEWADPEAVRLRRQADAAPGTGSGVRRSGGRRSRR